MSILIALTVGLVWWIAAWAFGVKAFDAFLFTALHTVAAGGVRIALTSVEKILKGAPATPGDS